jgi:hypothetical protein
MSAPPILVREVTIDGGASHAPHVPFRDITLFQERGQRGLVVSSHVIMSAGPMGDETTSATAPHRIDVHQLERFTAWLVARHSRGVADEFWERLAVALQRLDAEPWREATAADHDQIAAGRKAFWTDPEDRISRAPETVEARVLAAGHWLDPEGCYRRRYTPTRLAVAGAYRSGRRGDLYDRVGGVDIDTPRFGSYEVEPDEGQAAEAEGLGAVVLRKEVRRDGPLIQARYVLPV